MIIILAGVLCLVLSSPLIGAEPDWYDWFDEEDLSGSSVTESVGEAPGTGAAPGPTTPAVEPPAGGYGVSPPDHGGAGQTRVEGDASREEFALDPNLMDGGCQECRQISEEVVEEVEAGKTGFCQPLNSWEYQLTMNGGVGPLRLKSAFLAPPRVMGVGLWAEYLSTDSMVIDGDSITRVAGNLSMVYSPVRYLELGMGVKSYGVDNSFTSPPFLVSAGDFMLSAFFAVPVAPWMAAGAGFRMELPNNLGQSGYNFQSISYEPTATVSFDLRKIRPVSTRTELVIASQETARQQKAHRGIPLRLHLNGGFLFDNSSKLSDQLFTLSEQYSMGVNNFDMVALGAGLELIPVEWFAPFAEWHLRIPVETRSSTLDVCLPELPCPGQPHIGYSSYPHWVSLGVKISPARGFTISAAVDLGITEKVASGITSIPPYNYLFGFTYMPDVKDRVIVRNIVRTVESTVPIVAPAVVPDQARLKGVVVDATTMERIAGAIVVYQGDTRLTPQATSADGVFVSYDLPAGVNRLDIGLPGQYKVGKFQVNIPSRGTVELAFPLEAESNPMNVIGRVYGPEDEPVTKGTVTLLYEGGPARLSLDGEGRFQAQLPPGTVRVQVIGEGYLALEREVAGQAGDKILMDLALAKAETPSVEVVDREIVIRKPIHFETGHVRIEAGSYNILDQVMDAMVRHQVKRLKVSGHTDSVGGEEFNQTLSEERAEAVKAYLVERGIAANRIDVQGYGMSQPIAPNITAQGRALNRRVEFFVLD